MNCDCFSNINDKLEPDNLQLTGYAIVLPDFKVVITIRTEWLHKDKAPKGKKNSPPPMIASFCPFCGKPAK